MDREENRREDADALASAGVAVHATHITSVAVVASELRVVRSLLGLAADSDPPAVEHQPGRADPDHARAPATWATAFVAIWRRPWMTCNGSTYGSSMLASIGVHNVFAASADAYPTVTLADVAERRPDLVLLPSEPYPFGLRHVAEIREAMPADVRLINGQDLFWWGARTPGARDRLARALASQVVSGE